ncbi:MAG: hypothetical protein FWD08_02595, partial [Alphaproteobacteria bacterium]|nr:hypothetical protein [Alphaproteobacteria bacterium]
AKSGEGCGFDGGMARQVQIIIAGKREERVTPSPYKRRGFARTFGQAAAQVLALKLCQFPAGKIVQGRHKVLIGLSTGQGTTPLVSFGQVRSSLG